MSHELIRPRTHKKRPTPVIQVVLVILASALAGAGLVGASALPSAPSVAQPETYSLAYPENLTDPALNRFGGGWVRSQGDSNIAYRWSGTSLDVSWVGECVAPSTITVKPQNAGYFSHEISGAWGIDQDSEFIYCGNENSFFSLGNIGMFGPSFWKCFGFTEIWLETDRGQSNVIKLQIPAWFPEFPSCPPSAKSNNPAVIADLTLQTHNVAGYHPVQPVITEAPPSTPPPNSAPKKNGQTPTPTNEGGSSSDEPAAEDGPSDTPAETGSPTSTGLIPSNDSQNPTVSPSLTPVPTRNTQQPSPTP